MQEILYKWRGFGDGDTDNRTSLDANIHREANSEEKPNTFRVLMFTQSKNIELTQKKTEYIPNICLRARCSLYTTLWRIWRRRKNICVVSTYRFAYSRRHTCQSGHIREAPYCVHLSALYPFFMLKHRVQLEHRQFYKNLQLLHIALDVNGASIVWCSTVQTHYTIQLAYGRRNSDTLSVRVASDTAAQSAPRDGNDY